MRIHNAHTLGATASGDSTMQTLVYDINAPKRALNLSINSDLQEEARKYKVNLSKLLEQALIETLAEKKRTEWLEQNRTALEAYNQRIEERGTFSDGLRRF
jgi:antitoxin CcdA